MQFSRDVVWGKEPELRTAYKAMQVGSTVEQTTLQ